MDITHIERGISKQTETPQNISARRVVRGREMNYCPNCNNILRWYLKYIGGIARANWHCDKCGYDTMTIKTILSDRTYWKE